MATSKTFAPSAVTERPRKNRRGSETRRLDKLLSLRMTTDTRGDLDALAAGLGFKTTQEYLWSLVGPALEQARADGLIQRAS